MTTAGTLVCKFIEAGEADKARKFARCFCLNSMDRTAITTACASRQIDPETIWNRRFRVDVGNTDNRKGHRRDCAQVRVTILVEASSPAEAMQRVRELCSAETFVPSTPRRPNEVAGHGLEGIAGVRVLVHPDRIRISDVREVER